VSTANAFFLGIANCSLCHTTITTEFAQQAHGKNFHTAYPGLDLISGFGGRCAPCHTTGYDEPSGYNAGGQLNVGLEGIQCEECHGPGSGHFGNEAHINRIPAAGQTCWDCHVPSYKMLRSTVNATSDADLDSTAPNKVIVRQPQALMFNGVGGYQYAGSAYHNHEHSLIANSCVTCHLYVPNGGPVTHGAEALEPDEAACLSCHRSATAHDVLLEETQADFKALLVQLGGEDPAAPGEPDPNASGGLLADWAAAKGIDITTNNDPSNPAVRAYKAARWNYFYVLNDKSFGVHNADYAGQLLNHSIASLTTSGRGG
jgi:hypothetical protein